MVPYSNEIFESPAMKDVLVYLERAAQSSVSVLLLGPSGSGKEVLAMRLHRLSPRANAPFVAINCGALHEELLLSELFGHEAGAFTGAVHPKRGLVEEADGGTLFLDEVGELPQGVQAQILRFLQSGEFYPVGSNELKKVDARIVGATNRDLEHAVELGAYREDLFYRLSTITLQVPPLCEREEDLEALVRQYVHDPILGGRPMDNVEPDAMQALRDYPWPGNVRQLKNVIERSKILSTGSILSFHHLPREIAQPPRDLTSWALPPAHTSLEEVERRHILNCLEYHQGNKTQTARTLGITVKTLYNKLARYER